MTRATPTHSPAPWKESGEEYGEHTHVLSAEGLYVAEYVLVDADRRLILSAPKLLAACRAAVLDRDPDNTFHHIAAMKALVDQVDGGEV
jgi:hypothetical protein